MDQANTAVLSEKDYEKAFDLYEQAAKMGSADANYMLGMFYENGIYPYQDYEKAVYYYETAASEGYFDAFYNLGNFYTFGDVVEQDPELAILYFQLAAYLGNEEAQTVLDGLSYAGSYMLDLGDVDSLLRAASYFYDEGNYTAASAYNRLAADAGNTEAMARLGQFYRFGFGVVQSDEKAVGYFLRAADLGNLDAMYILGELYLEGEGVDQDTETAIQYFTMAADLGDEDARAILDDLAERSEVDEILQQAYAAVYDDDFEKAFSLFEQAAESGSDEACFMLGIFYYVGSYPYQDYEKADYYFEIAACEGEVDAFYYLALLYANGDGVEKSSELANLYLQLAAYMGDEDALEIIEAKPDGNFSYMENLDDPDFLLKAGTYYRGEGNLTASIAHYRLAADAGSAVAMGMLGQYYRYGDGVLQSYDKAIDYFLRAADLGNSAAMYVLGELYLAGEGVEQNTETAIQYFTMAADLGDEDAQAALVELALQGEDTTESAVDLQISGDYEEIPLTAMDYYSRGEKAYEAGDYQTALDNYKKAADIGHDGACYSLGFMYFSGDGVRQSYDEAAGYFQLAADLGSVEGKLLYGYMLNEGLGVTRSSKAAAKYWQSCTDDGESICMVNLATLYFDGDGVNQSFDKGVELIRMAAAEGNRDALDLLEELVKAGAIRDIPVTFTRTGLYNLGEDALMEGNWSAAAYYLQEAADQWDPEAARELGLLYYNGRGVERSLEKAAKYFKQAADYGDTEGCYYIAALYEEGAGVEQSYEKAAEYYTSSALQGNEYAQLALANLYLMGRGVDRNVDQAVYYLQLSANQGNEEAAEALTKLLSANTKQPGPDELHKKGVSAYESGKYAEALAYFEAAMEAGNIDAPYYLGLMYAEGQGVEQSYEKAAEYYTSSANQGNEYAQVAIGTMYLWGQGVEQDFDQAVYYFGLAVDQGNEDAADLAAAMTVLYTLFSPEDEQPEDVIPEEPSGDDLYQQGWDAFNVKDYENALVLWNQAADLGNVQAINMLGNMYFNPIGVEKDDQKAIEYYLRAMELGNFDAVSHMLEATLNVAEAYENDGDLENALYYYQLAAKNGSKKAQKKVAELEQSGDVKENVPEDKADIEYSEMIWLANDALDAGDFETGIALLHQAADEGHDSNAEDFLGYMYYTGTGVEQDYELAFEYYERSALQGNPYGQYDLASLYDRGEGVRKNLQKAFEYYLASAEQGIPEAMLEVGIDYFYGWGVEQNRETAIEYYLMAAEAGLSDAALYLQEAAVSYEIAGDFQKALRLYESAGQYGVEEAAEKAEEMKAAIKELTDRAAKASRDHDYVTALENWQEAAARGDVDSMNRVGLFYYWGAQYGGVWQVEKNYEKAIEYFQMAQAQGNTENKAELISACEYVALDLEANGDIEGALSYYQMAADLGSEAAAMKIKFLTDPYVDDQDIEAMVQLGLIAYSNENYAEARIYLEGPAEMGNADALNTMAEMYYYGQGVPQIPEKAAEFYQRSADQDNVRGIGQLAHMYTKGYGVEPDYAKAEELYRRGMMLNSAFCTRNLGLMYAEGTGVEQSWETAASLYRIAADQEDPVAIHFLSSMTSNGEKAMNEGNYETAWEMLRAAADSGQEPYAYDLVGRMYRDGLGTDPDADEALKYFVQAAAYGNANGQNDAGLSYLEGAGTEKNEEQAFEMFQMAAEQGLAEAQVSLGKMYLDGIGTEQDFEQAADLFQKAADQGSEDAQVQLAFMRENGMIPEEPETLYQKAVEAYDAEDYETAAEYLKTAADQGLAEAQDLLGEMYYYGRGVKKSWETAVEYYRLAADQGNADGQYHLGFMYKYGSGVEKSLETAAEYFHLSAAQGNLQAMVRLGAAYEFGYGVEQSDAIAFRYYLQAANPRYNEARFEGGRNFTENLYTYAEAQYRTGYCYRDGKGTEQSYDRAVHFFELAAENGFISANTELGKLYENGIGVEQDIEKAIAYYQVAADSGYKEAQEALIRLGVMSNSDNN